MKRGCVGSGVLRGGLGMRGLIAVRAARGSA